MASKKANSVIKASCRWWAKKRPAEWDIEKHLMNPVVNTSGSEKVLANAVADFLRPMKNPGEWEK